MIAYTPFLDPLNLHDAWWLTLLPMALFISMAYKAVRVPTMKGYWKQVSIMTSQIILAMVALAAGFFLLIEFCVPLLES